MSIEIIPEFLLFQSREDRADVEHGPRDVHGIRIILYLQLQGLLQVFQGRVVLLLPKDYGKRLYFLKRQPMLL